MGQPMCRNLVAAGHHRVVVHDVRPEPVAALVEAGAVDGGSVAGVVTSVDLVLLSLPGGPELEAVVAGADGILSVIGQDHLVVDHTTAPLALTRELAARCRERGAGWCDAPIARTRQAAIDGTLSIMVGGDPADVERIAPVLATMATDVTHCGGVGSGQVTKLLNNMMLFQNVRAIAEAHAIACGLVERHGDDLGLDIGTVFDVIAEASGGSFALRNHGQRAILVDDYPTRAFPIDYAIKDLGYALELAAETGVDAVGARTVGQLMEAAREAGWDDHYFPVLRRML
jgi:3-hydroxyisobutyrate dehydrogenase-like beta-hydroxyacid dehydrogenase